MTDLENRRRAIEPNHVRTVEVQSLDALLRIEETLTSILEGLRHFAKQLNQETDPGFKEPGTTKGKRK